MASPGGGDFFELGSDDAIGFALGHRLADRWTFRFDVSRFRFSNDIDVALADSIGTMYNNAEIHFEQMRLGVLFDRMFLAPRSRINVAVGLGGGLMVWKGTDASADTTLTVLGKNNETTDFAASELYLTGGAALIIRPTERISLHLQGHADYLTGAGAEFSSDIADSRDRWLFGVAGRLMFHFGGGGGDDRNRWPSDSAWRAQTPSDEPIRMRTDRDSDGDGVADRDDRCLNTARGVIVDSYGCPLDSDRDGIPDGLDDCPGTNAAALGRVDIHGCPIDSDFDGVPDYTDACPNNEVGALVDSAGCPIDSDRDGVPDGLDDCPYTLPDVEVDKFGCIDLEMFSQPMVLNIDYPPGSFEVDPRTKDRLRRLAGLLNFVKDIRLDINGYTDNIGTPVANKSLSEKRAERVRNFLSTMGVDASRMTVHGRGESNFVASNQTAEGRAMNRRIEIIFYR